MPWLDLYSPVSLGDVADSLELPKSNISLGQREVRNRAYKRTGAIDLGGLRGKHMTVQDTIGSTFGYKRYRNVYDDYASNSAINNFEDYRYQMIGGGDGQPSAKIDIMAQHANTGLSFGDIGIMGGTVGFYNQNIHPNSGNKPAFWKLKWSQEQPYPNTRNLYTNLEVVAWRNADMDGDVTYLWKPGGVGTGVGGEGVTHNETDMFGTSDIYTYLEATFWVIVKSGAPAGDFHEARIWDVEWEPVFI